MRKMNGESLMVPVQMLCSKYYSGGKILNGNCVEFVSLIIPDKIHSAFFSTVFFVGSTQ